MTGFWRYVFALGLSFCAATAAHATIIFPDDQVMLHFEADVRVENETVRMGITRENHSVVFDDLGQLGTFFLRDVRFYDNHFEKHLTPEHLYEIDDILVLHGRVYVLLNDRRKFGSAKTLMRIDFRRARVRGSHPMRTTCLNIAGFASAAALCGYAVLHETALNAQPPYGPWIAAALTGAGIANGWLGLNGFKADIPMRYRARVGALEIASVTPFPSNLEIREDRDDEGHLKDLILIHPNNRRESLEAKAKAEACQDGLAADDAK